MRNKGEIGVGVNGVFLIFQIKRACRGGLVSMPNADMVSVVMMKSTKFVRVAMVPVAASFVLGGISAGGRCQGRDQQPFKSLWR
jgi:hypothetical protein